MCEKAPPVMVPRGTRKPLQTDLPLTAIQAAVLELLVENGPMMVNEIERRGISTSGLQGLRSRGLVLRERLTGRQVRYAASEKGRSYLAEVADG